MNELRKESTAPSQKEGAPIASPSATTFRRPDLLQVLNKNSHRRYRWLNFEKLRASGGMHHNGWRAITALSGSEEAILKEHGLENVKFVDGAIRRYEMVLAFMPLDQWKELKNQKEEARRAPLEKVRRHERGLEHNEFQREKWPGRS